MASVANKSTGRRLGAELDSLDPESFIGTEAAAAAIGKHPDTLARWRRERRFLAFVQLGGGECLYRVTDLVEFVRAARIEPIKARGRL